jgi:hypothetical protein
MRLAADRALAEMALELHARRRLSRGRVEPIRGDLIRYAPKEIDAGRFGSVTASSA